jgi:chaperonin GroEL
LRCKEAVEKCISSCKGDEKIGANIVLSALPSPLVQIVNNGGLDGTVVADEVLEKGATIGFNANTGTYVDMFKAGIIDPVKVVRTALANAASIAGLMLTTEALVTNFEKDDKSKRGAEGVVR